MEKPGGVSEEECVWAKGAHLHPMKDSIQALEDRNMAPPCVS